MRVGIPTDHGGFALKQEFLAHLRTAGHEVVDFGAHNLNPASSLHPVRSRAKAGPPNGWA
jgi:ribose 5-phosphate isomerase RpiB